MKQFENAIKKVRKIKNTAGILAVGALSAISGNANTAEKPIENPSDYVVYNAEEAEHFTPEINLLKFAVDSLNRTNPWFAEMIKKYNMEIELAILDGGIIATYQWTQPKKLFVDVMYLKQAHGNLDDLQNTLIHEMIHKVQQENVDVENLMNAMSMPQSIEFLLFSELLAYNQAAILSKTYAARPLDDAEYYKPETLGSYISDLNNIDEYRFNNFFENINLDSAYTAANNVGMLTDEQFTNVLKKLFTSGPLKYNLNLDTAIRDIRKLIYDKIITPKIKKNLIAQTEMAKSEVLRDSLNFEIKNNCKKQGVCAEMLLELDGANHKISVINSIVNAR